MIFSRADEKVSRFILFPSFFFRKSNRHRFRLAHSFDELYKFRVIRVERDICIGGRVENCSGTIHATNSKLFI